MPEFPRTPLRSTAALLSVPLVANTTDAFGREKLSGSGEMVVCLAQIRPARDLAKHRIRARVPGRRRKI
ncbi:hypothetical protein ACVIYL_009032 [Bradyrhizobium sp. USDA 3315]